MKSITLAFMSIFFVFIANSQTVHKWYQDGIVIFQLKKNSSTKIQSKNKIVDFQNVDFIQSLTDRYGVFHVTQLHPNDSDELLRLTYQIEFEQMDKVDELTAELGKLDLIEYAEKKELHISFLTPNDLGANTTTGTGVWHLYKMNAQQAWDLSTGSAAVRVAITDDAILTTHVDLANKIVATYDAPTGGTNANPCGTNNGNHGTHVSGTAGAQTNNGTGVSSIGYNVSLMAVKIGNCNGSLTHGYEGINWAANNGANVINMSWGGGGFSNYGQNVCNAAVNAGAILVAAAGNDGTNQQFYPAAYASVVAVASTTTNDAKSSFSQYGTWVNIAAPGSAIYSTYATSLYSRIQGTSMASPNVAGLLGLMKSYAPNVSNQNLINCLYSSATNIDAVNSGFIGQLGAGRINAYQALLCLQQYNVSVDAGITAITSPGVTVCSGSFTPTVTLRNFGQNALTSVVINYQWNGAATTFNWTGNLTTGQTAQVNLPVQTGPAGSYTFTAFTSNPNGVADQNNSNNQSQISFAMDPNGQTVNLSIITDCYGDEITWNIRNATNQVVASGGPFTNLPSGSTTNYPICLPVGCYTFNIVDSYGDGMYGSQWPNCGINGNYFMTGPGGNSLFQMTAANANFGFTASHSFCVTSPNIQNDAGISQVISPQGIICATSITPVVELRNYGSSPLTAVTINYQAGGAPQVFNWTGSLASGLVTNVTLPALSVTNGSTTLSSFTTLPNGVADQNTANDQSQKIVMIHASSLSLPFVESFENNPFTQGSWVIDNPDNEITWEIATIIGTTPGNKAAKMNFFQYAQSARRDGMISPRLNFAGYSSITMTLEHAYRRFDQTTTDSLIIYVSTNCGQTYQRVFARGENGTGTFATASTTNQAFSPASTNEWCMGTVGSDCYSINLDAFVGQQVTIKIEGYNSGTVGNNLYIDNINITGTGTPVAPVASFTSTPTAATCTGQTVQYTSTSTGIPTTYAWTFAGGTPATSTVQNPIVTYATAGTYNASLTVTNSSGTNTSNQTNYITVNASPTAPTTTPANRCGTGTVTLGATASAGTLSWFAAATGGTALGTGANFTTPSISTTTTYYVSSTASGCTSARTPVVATINPTPTVTNPGNKTACLGSAVAAISFAGSSTSSTYAWTNSNTGLGLAASGTGNIAPFTPTTTGTTTVSVTPTLNGCPGTVVTFTITVNPLPTVTLANFATVCDTDGSFALSGGTPTGGTYSGTGVTNNNYNPSTAGAGTYTITYTASQNGCSNTATNTIQVDACAGIDEVLSNLVIIYPNPTGGMLTVKDIPLDKVTEMELIDAAGRKVGKWKLTNSVFNVDLSAYASGSYNLIFTGKDVQLLKRLEIKK
jgi:PKD repeat protein